MIHFCQLNRAGLDSKVILKYQSTSKVQQMISDILNGDVLPDIEIYSGTVTIADGIHRISAYLYLGILQFNFKYY